MSRTIRNERCFSEYDFETRGGRFSRDRKPWWKPNKVFKKLRRRKEKALSKQAFRVGREIPRFRHGDVWEWN